MTLLVIAGYGAAVLAFTHYEPYHRAQRDADRVFRTLTGTDPIRRQRDGTYLGDQPPTGRAFGPLTAPTTVRAEMVRFRSALLAAGYLPDEYADSPRVWCDIRQDDDYLPASPPTTVEVSCSITATRIPGKSYAQISLTFDVPPGDLHPTRTAIGHLRVDAESAVDLVVALGTIEVGVSQMP